MSDKSLRESVIDELEWEPSIDAQHIGVTAENGVVTLTGHVNSYAERFAAERAAQRVRGVRAIAEEIEVRFPNDKKTSDDQIAKRALDILAWNSTVPSDQIRIKVQDGIVTLSGEVEWYYQSKDAEKTVRKLSGVTGIINDIKIRPRVQIADIKQRIENALRRNAEAEADTIKVSVEGGRVTLEGRVKAWYERDLAKRTAWSAPGVVSVVDKISII